MSRALALLALLAIGCGRLGFDALERDVPGDGPRDADLDAPDGGVAASVALVTPTIPGDNDKFGARVAISGDGSTLAIGAYGEASSATGVDGDPTDNSANLSGAVYVFTRSGQGWAQQAYLKASNTDAGDVFGWSVALSADGDTLAVGAPDEDSGSTSIDVGQSDNAVTNAGAVYVFTRTGSSWSQQAYVKAVNTNAGDSFGETVALSEIGDVLAVGAIFEDGDGTGATGNPLINTVVDSGAVYVFTRSADVWTSESYLKASNTDAGDIFGISLALSGDGARIAVGATAEQSAASGIDGDEGDNSQPQAGAVYLFQRDGPTWSQEAYFKASNPDGGDFFGYAVALSRDGNTLAVSAEGEDSSSTGVGGPQIEGAGQAGAAYVFARSPTLVWSQEAYLKASNAAADDRFGRSISLAADGNRLVVGAPQEDSAAIGLGGNQADDTAPDSGAAYAYTRTATTWSFVDYIKASDTTSGDAFGVSVAVSADGASLLIGAADVQDARGSSYVVE